MSYVREAVAELQVDNFAAACAVIDRVSLGNVNFREITGATLSVEGFQFDVRIVWGIDSKGRPDRGKEIGFYIVRTDQQVEAPAVRYQFRVLNCTADKHRKVVGKYERMRQRTVMGLSPSFKKPHGIPRLPLSKVLDETQGWLHDRALRAACSLTVVSGFVREAPAVDLTQTHESLRDSFKALLDSKCLADVVIKVGGEHLHVHSAVLAARSPVFSVMLSSAMKESREREIEIADLDAAAIKELVSYFYTGDFAEAVLEEDGSALALLQAAHRYDVPSVVEKCAAALRTRLTPATVSERLELADMIDSSALKAHCLQFMRQYIHEVQDSPSYKGLAKRRPSLLMDIVAAVAGPVPKKQRRNPQAEGS